MVKLEQSPSLAVISVDEAMFLRDAIARYGRDLLAERATSIATAHKVGGNVELCNADYQSLLMIVNRLMRGACGVLDACQAEGGAQ